MENDGFIKGALIGCAIGGLAILLIAPKSGKQLRDDILEGYNAINCKSHEFADEVQEKGHTLFKKISDLVSCEEECEAPNHNCLFIGGAMGAVIGAIAALLLAPQASHKLRRNLGENYEKIRDKAEEIINNISSKKVNLEDNIDDWKNTFLAILDKFSSTKNRKASGSSKFDDLADWANLGLRLYNQFQKRG